MSYDTKCHDLARLFLSDCSSLNPASFSENREKYTDQLAQAIQDIIESFIEENGLTR